MLTNLAISKQIHIVMGLYAAGHSLVITREDLGFRIVRNMYG